MRAYVIALIGAGALLLGMPVTAAARAARPDTAVTVSTTADDMTNNGNCTLREALKAVEMDAAVDHCPNPASSTVVNVPAGTYQLKLGELQFTSRVKLVGAGASSTFVKGKGETASTASRVLHVEGGAVVDVSNITASSAYTGIRNDGVLTLTRMTVSGNGYDAMNFSGDYPAAGLDNRGTATLTHVTFNNNGGPQFALAGVAMISNAKGKTVSLNSSTLEHGHVDGTAIDNSGQLDVNSTIFNSASDDEFPDSLGEDIFNETTGNAQIKNSTFENEGADGGTYAIENNGIASADKIVINNNMGALYNGGTLHVTNSTISNNSYGDLIDNAGGSLQIATTSIIGNRTGFNAAIWNFGGSAVLVNVTIAGNTMGDEEANGVAGAIDNSATMTARNVTITGNQFLGGAGHPGGIANAAGATFKIANSIVAGNTNPDDTNARDCKGKFNSLGWNLVQSTAGGCTFVGTTTGNIYSKAPKLGAVANNGGPTKTELPQAGSPAIDAGNPAAPGTSPPQLCPLFDQRNVARPRDGNHDGTARCDIGAVEL